MAVAVAVDARHTSRSPKTHGERSPKISFRKTTNFIIKFIRKARNSAPKPTNFNIKLTERPSRISAQKLTISSFHHQIDGGCHQSQPKTNKSALGWTQWPPKLAPTIGSSMTPHWVLPQSALGKVPQWIPQ